jgi:hypothetical protein
VDFGGRGHGCADDLDLLSRAALGKVFSKSVRPYRLKSVVYVSYKRRRVIPARDRRGGRSPGGESGPLAIGKHN